MAQNANDIVHVNEDEMIRYLISYHKEIWDKFLRESTEHLNYFGSELSPMEWWNTLPLHLKSYAFSMVLCKLHSFINKDCTEFSRLLRILLYFHENPKHQHEFTEKSTHFFKKCRLYSLSPLIKQYDTKALYNLAWKDWIETNSDVNSHTDPTTQNSFFKRVIFYLIKVNENFDTDAPCPFAEHYKRWIKKKVDVHRLAALEPAPMSRKTYPITIHNEYVDPRSKFEEDDDEDEVDQHLRTPKSENEEVAWILLQLRAGAS